MFAHRVHEPGPQFLQALRSAPHAVDHAVVLDEEIDAVAGDLPAEREECFPFRDRVERNEQRIGIREGIVVGFVEEHLDLALGAKLVGAQRDGEVGFAVHRDELGVYEPDLREPGWD